MSERAIVNDHGDTGRRQTSIPPRYVCRCGGAFLYAEFVAHLLKYKVDLRVGGPPAPLHKGSTAEAYFNSTERLEARDAAIAEHPNEALCGHCAWPVSSHPELPSTNPRDICAPFRVCPTSLFAVRASDLETDIAAAVKEHRAR